MSSVDNRIVEMRFDNKDFEDGVSTSLTTLEKLKESLNLDGATKGLESVDKAAKSISLDSISESVEKVADHFSSLQIIADEVLRKIGDSIYDLAEQAVSLVKSMSVDQVTEGFSKYEKKTQAVQTIMNATGKSIDEVSDSLDKLNWYTDETSYDFTSMVDNISKFTSNSVDLDTAITSMIGIANAAGLAGSSVDDASHAMQGFSKAIAQGYMTRTNWQWIQTAHMDTTQFKEILIESAEAMGTLISTGDGLYETLEGTTVSVADFETALKDGWMTTDVMNDALAQFGSTTEEIYEEFLKTGDLTSDIIARMAIDMDDLGLKSFKAAQEAKTFTDAINSVKDAVSTGWMMSFEFIFGNYEEAVSLWTNVANELWDVFAGGAEARNTMLKEWHDAEGYATALEAVANIWSGLKAILYSVQDAARDVFPAMTSERLLTITSNVRDFTAKFKEAFTYVEEATDAVEEFVEPITETTEEVTEVAQEVAQVAYDVNELANRVINGEFGNGEERKEQLEALGYSYEKIQNRVNELLGCNVRLVETEEDLTDTVTETTDAVEEVTDAISEAAETVDEAAEPVETTSNIISNLQSTVRGCASVLSIFGQAIKAVNKVLVKPALKVAVSWLAKGLSYTAKLGDKITEISTKLKEENYFEEKLNKLVSYFDTAKAAVDDFYKQAQSSAAIQTFLGYVDSAKNKVKSWFDKIKESFSSLSELEFNFPTGSELLAIFDNLASKANKVIEALTPFFTLLSEKIQQLKSDVESINFESLQNSIATSDSWFAKMARKIGSFFSTVWEEIKNFFNQFKDASSENFTKIFTDEFEKIKTKFSEFKENFSFSDLFEIPKEKWSNFTSTLSTIGTAIANFASQITPAKVVLAVFVGIFASLLLSARKLMNSTSGVMKSATSLISSFSSQIKASPLRQIALAIIILAAALTILSKVDSASLKQATNSMLEVMGALVAMTAILGVISRWLFDEATVIKFQSIGVAMLELSGAVLVVAIALRTLDKVNMDGMAAKLAVVGGVIVALAVIAVLMALVPTKSEVNALPIIALAASLYIVVLALKKLENVDLENVKNNIGVLIIIIALMAVLGLAASKVKFGGAAGLMLLCFDLLIFVGVMKILANVSTAKMLSALPNFIAIFALMIPLCIAARLAGKNAASAGAAILLMSIAMLVIAKAIDQIGSLDESAVKQGMTVVAELMALFAVITALFSFSSYEPTGAAKVGASLLLMAAAILVLGIAIKYIGELDPETAKQGAIIVESILAIFTVMIAVGKAAKGSASAIVAMTVALVAITAAFILLEDIPFSNLMSSAAALSSVLLALAGATRLVKASKWSDALVSTLQMAALLYALVGAFLLMKDLDGMNLLEQASGIAVACISLAAATKIISSLKFGDLKSVGVSLAAFAGVAVVVGLVMTAIVALTATKGFQNFMANSEQICLALVELEAVILVLIGLEAVMGVIGTMGVKNISVGALGLVEVFGVFAVLLLAISGLTKTECFNSFVSNSEQICLALVELEAVILVLIGLEAVMGVVGMLGVKSLSTGALGLVEVAAVVALCLLGLSALTECEGFNSFVANSEQICTALLRLADVVAAFAIIEAAVGAIGTFANPVAITDGLYGLIGVIGVIGSLVAALAALSTTFSDASWEALDNGILIIQKIGESIGKFVGGIVEGFTDELPNIADNLSSFADKLQGFLSCMASLSDSNSGAIAGAANLVSMLLDMTQLKTSKLEQIDMEGIATKLSDFSEPFSSFCESVKDVDGANVEACANAALALASLENSLPSRGGKLDNWFGTSEDLETFGTQLQTFASGFTLYYLLISAISPIDQSVVDASISAAQSLAGLNDYLPNTGGNLQTWIGQPDLASFGTNLATFASGFVAYYNTISAAKINYKTVTKSADAAKALAEMNDALPSTGGTLMNWLCGDKDLSLFGTNLESFGTSLVNYYNTIKNAEIDTDIIQTSKDAGTMLADLNEAIPTDGGFWGWITGKQGLDDFGTNLTAFGEGIASYYKSLDGISLYRIGMSATYLGQMADVWEKISELKGNDLGDFGDDLEDFGASISSFNSTISKVTWTDFSDAMTAVDNFATMATTLNSIETTGITNFSAGVLSLAQAGILAFVNAFEEADTDAEDAVTGFIDAAGLAIDGKQSDMETKGESLTSYVADGMRAKKTAVQTAASVVAYAGSTTLSDYYDTYQYIGNYLMQGFANGVYNNAWRVTNAASYVADQAAQKIKDVLDINSPSGVTEEYGEYFSQGLVNGILNLAGSVTNASDQISDGAIEAMQNSIQRISDIVSGDIDMTPTIRPVLDLSNVRSGARQISSMLNYKNALDSGIGSTSVQISQNGFIESDLAEKVQALNTNNQELLDSINRQSEIMEDVKDLLSSQKIVMDSGEVVGVVSRGLRMSSLRSR
jgi:methyl-accepting chemotaxis protein